jgi:hypothetical protein
LTGVSARSIEKGNGKAAQYKDGFDHALKDKSRSNTEEAEATTPWG